jgi:hypothetical protein
MLYFEFASYDIRRTIDLQLNVIEHDLIGM